VMTRSKTTTLCVSIVTAGVLALAASPAGAVTSISSSSYGVSVDLSILSLVDVGLLPVAPASGTAPAPYSAFNQVLSVTSSTSLIALPLVTSGLDLNTGVITDTASSGFMPFTSGTANSTIDNLASNLGLSVSLGPLVPPVITSVLNISATTISSTSSVSGSGVLSATGLTTLEDLNISGTAVGGSLVAGLTATPSANDVIWNTGGLEIILNAQTPLAGENGTTSEGITTDAIEVIFSDFLLNGNLLNGDVVIGQSNADIFGLAAAPEPATWALMLTGFAGMGAALRVRRRRQAASA
jgi:hypothetical protein